MPGYCARVLLAFAIASADSAFAQTAAPLPNVITPSFSRQTATARRDRTGRFSFDATVNGAPLLMTFDTGATSVSLRGEDAASLGIDVGGLHYSQTVRTAHGTTQMAPVIIKVLSIGDIERRNIPALVAKPGDLNDNLLGQSFLSRLAGYRFEGADLVLEGER